MAPNYTIGIDLAQVNDFSALAVVERLVARSNSQLARLTMLDHHYVRHIKRWEQGTPYATVVKETGELIQRGRIYGDRIAGTKDEYEVKRPGILEEAIIVIDGTGVGREVADLYMQAHRLGRLGRWWPRAVVITGGRETTDQIVPKRELVGKMQTLLQSGRLKVADSLPQAELLRKEMLEFKVKMTPTGQETYESARERGHDDLVIAVALACWYRHSTTEPRWLPEEARLAVT